MRRFADKSLVDDDYFPTEFGLGPYASFEAVNTVEFGPEVRNFVLEEIPWEETQRILMDNAYMMKCDAIIGLFDSSDALSFGQLANIFRSCSRAGMPIKGRFTRSVSIPSTTVDDVPVVIISNKKDLTTQKQV